MAEDMGPSLPVTAVVMSRRQKWAASIVMLWFVGTAALMAIPWSVARPMVLRSLRPTLPLLYNIGIHHRLVLFSPSPPRWTGVVQFRVTFTDGERENWTFPRSVLSPGDPPGSYNRYLFYYAVWSFPQTSRLLQPHLARFIAEDSFAQGRQPATVEFIERFARIPPPEEGMGAPPLALTEERVLLRYDVSSRRAEIVGKPLVW